MMTALTPGTSGVKLSGAGRMVANALPTGMPPELLAMDRDCTTVGLTLGPGYVSGDLFLMPASFDIILFSLS
jgi:hypothetical protein